MRTHDGEFLSRRYDCPTLQPSGPSRQSVSYALTHAAVAFPSFATARIAATAYAAEAICRVYRRHLLSVAPLPIRGHR